MQTNLVQQIHALSTELEQLDRQAMVSIDYETLADECCRVSADQAEAGRLYAQARRHAVVAEHTRKAAHARAFIAAPAILQANGAKATNPACAAQADMDPTYAAAIAAEAQADHNKWAAKTLFDSISSKVQMLVSLGADQRQEHRSFTD